MIDAADILDPDLLGVVNLDKPAGVSSSQAVVHIRKVLTGTGWHGPRLKVGHAGTLDPAATGVLLVLVGRAVKLTDVLMDAPKQYVATVRLGATSTTDDAEGEIAERPEAAPPSGSALRAALAGFVGTIRQRPPAFSAVHVEGQRAYKLARQGRPADLPERAVTVRAVELTRYDWPTAELRIDCGRGVYVRSIARDLGEALRVAGYLAALRRTRVGPFTADDAAPMHECQVENVYDWLAPVETAVAALPRVELADAQASRLANGNRLAGNELACGALADDAGPIAAFDPVGRLVAICRLSSGLLAPVQVLRRAPGAS